jgi:homoserine kinase
MSESAFRIVVPGSTSNLGPGFDCLGLALDRRIVLEWRSEDGGGLVVRGERPPPGFGDRLAGGLGALGLPEGGTLQVDSTIPVGRGLGSSAALAVALHLLRSHLAGSGIHVGATLEAVTELEGHPDNAAPSLLGGLVAATRRAGSVSVTPLPLSDRIGWAWASPGVPSETRGMRAVLPGRIDHDAALRNAARVAHLIPALAAGDGETLRWAMDDELHVPMRLPLIPAGAEVRAAALGAGAWACTISGSGSGLIAAAPRGRTGDVVAAMAAAFRVADPHPDGARAFEVRPDLEGARWGREVTPRPGRLDEGPTRRG